jgi:hypothetical protein
MPGSAPNPEKKQDRAGLINPMLGFLDRNLSRFSQPVRDAIGIGILLILVIYVVNGLLGPTYIRGQLWVNREGRNHAAGWRVLHGDDEAVSDEKGWWTLPLPGSGIPGRIRLEVEDAGKDASGNDRRPLPMGEFHAFGPWPVLNTFRPMDNYVVDVYPDKPPGQRLQVANVEPFGFLPVKSVYAQAKDAQQQNQLAPTPQAPCALSLYEVKVSEFPGFLRSSGRAYFQMYLDDKLVNGNDLLYGPGIGSKAGQFPVQSDRELWLPVRTGSEDHYRGLLANLTEVADCSADSEGNGQIHAKGRIYLKMFTDRGDTLNSFDLTTVLASPNQKITLKGDPKGKATVTVEALVQPGHSKSVVVSGKTIWMDTGIQVMQGDKISFKATGQVQWATNGEFVGPEGSKRKRHAALGRPAYAVSTIGAGGLIARVGSGPAFGVGEKKENVVASGTGTLYLGINDNSPKDNTGQFLVSIVVWASSH